MKIHYVKAAFIGLALCSSTAYAGEHQDKLAKCLIASTPEQDGDVLVQWIFVAMAAHPVTNELATVPANKRKEVTEKATTVFEKLMTETCGLETLNTIKFEGTESIGKPLKRLEGLQWMGF